MEEKATPHASSSSPLWEHLAVCVREPIQRCIQALLGEAAPWSPAPLACLKAPWQLA